MDANCEDSHEYIEKEQHLVLDLTKVASYLVESECKHCESKWNSWRVVGQKPKTDSEFKSLLVELYESFYADPRPIGHFILQDLIPSDGTAITNTYASFLSAAVDLGCRDAEEGREIRSETEVLEMILPE